MASVQELREARSAKNREIMNLVENTPALKWDKETQEKYDLLSDEFTALETQINVLEKALQQEARLAQSIEKKADLQNISTDQAHNELHEEKKIFLSWLRHGKDGLTNEQHQFMAHKISQIQNSINTVVPTEGGYLAPPDFADQLLVALKAFGGIRSVAKQITTSHGRSIKYPTTDTTSQRARIVKEGEVVPAGDAINFGQIEIDTYTYSSLPIPVTFQTLQDNVVDLESFIIGELYDRIARGTSYDFINGTGTNEPMGVLNAASAGVLAGKGQVDLISYDDLLSLEHSVDPAYRSSASCTYVFNDKTLQALRKLKDNNGRPILLASATGSAQSAAPSILNGYRYVIDQAMPDLGAGNKPVLFGDFSKFTIRDVNTVLLLRMTDSKYAEQYSVGFLMFTRHGSNIVDASNSAIKYFQNAAS